MKRKIGRLCMVLGAVLILSAAGLLGYNRWDAARAEKASQEVLGELEQTMQKTITEHRQEIAEYDNRLELIDTYFPIVKELMPIAEQCREVGFTEELTRRIVSLQPVEFKGRLYSKEYKEKFRTEHSTATVERNPQEKGKFRLCIDGIPILDWFRKKFQEIKEKLGLNTPVENKQRKGLKI